MGTLEDMTTRADVERVAAQVALRSRLVEMVLHGDCTWTVNLNGDHVPAQADVGLDDEGNLFVSFLVINPTHDSGVYEVYADGDHVQTLDGQITKGRPCRLRVVFTETPAAAGV